eukprot:TRINITY_DN7485_c0_g2_i1.p1 TRINITY_DN7485_c0_g2~~TRINITY_DN7485_c0_g2_i1.p1  ORF type:complete len:910 (+),score=280.54 TRINITY_DN7485_c0_g2_i1:53-2731(+)
MAKVVGGGAAAGKRGEAVELKVELQSNSREQQRSALRKVIASMTVGRDVSNLFSDVVRLISSPHVDIKRLVYLYVAANAKMQQDKAYLLAGSFSKHAVMHESPLVRGLAVRTMSAIQVEKLADHVAQPLRSALRESDPYVRKCAAMAVAKMFATNKQRMEEGGFIQHLQELLTDSNPTVIAATVCALNEMSNTAEIDREQLDLNNRNGGMAVNDLLSALSDANGCNEWGQIYILEGLASYEAESQERAELICSRVLPKLQHSNAGVVLTTVRIILNYIERWCKGGATNEDTVKVYLQKIAPPLVSLVSGGTDFEIRYVALRNISMILQKFPDLLTHQVKMFFVKYNEPIYVKMEKLEIMLQLVNQTNVRSILSEFNEYAQEVDVEFVRKAVRAIGVTAIKIESAAEECAAVLSELIKTKVNYVVQESIIVVRDVFRKYPGRYEGLIALLCESLDTLDEPEAKAAMVWIIGEYAEKIENADELLDDFMESFEDENTEVQLSLLTAIVKLFLKRPDDTQELLQKVLQAASASEVPDLRDRGYMYWRLLSLDPQAGSSVVIGTKEIINEERGSKMDPKLVSQLLSHVGTLASVYHKPPATFIQNYVEKRTDDEGYDSDEEEVEHSVAHDASLPHFSTPNYTQHADPNQDMKMKPTAVKRGASVSRQVWCKREATGGVELMGRFIAEGNELFMDVCLLNTTQGVVSGFLMQLDTNPFGIAMAGALTHPQLNPGENFEALIPLTINFASCDMNKKAETAIKVALKSSAGLGFGTTGPVLNMLLNPSPGMTKDAFLVIWQGIDVEKQFALNTNAQTAVDQKFQSAGFTFVAKRTDNSTDGLNAVQDHYYYGISTITGQYVAIEVAFSSLSHACMVSIRSQAPNLSDLVQTYILGLQIA